MDNKTLTRFLSKINTAGPTMPHMATPCWEWTGYLNLYGYGDFKFYGPEPRQVKSHRVMWEHFHGRPVPDGLFVLHECDNPACCRPDHLRAGTQSENMLDMHKRGRHNAPTRLTKKQADEIRQRHRGLPRASDPADFQATLAAEYGVAQSTVSRIINNRLWK